MWAVEACSPGERAKLADMRNKYRKFQEELSRAPVPTLASGLDHWYAFMNWVKLSLGNANSEQSFLATLIAKRSLREAHPDAEFDASQKSISARGLDIDITAGDGKRIVGEVKTLLPYHTKDFGGKQRESVVADLEKLSKARADFKYLFVTEKDTYDILTSRYKNRVQGIAVVWLLEPKPPEPLPVM